MCDFRTKIPAKQFLFDIEYKSKILFIGSCFSDNISQKLIGGGFSVETNPFGVLYNPISIKNAFDILLNNKVFTEGDLFENNGLYHSFSHHSSFSNTNKSEVLEQINDSVRKNSSFLNSSDYIFITLGTAYAYRHLETNQIVSNCHKIPAKEFDHYLLSLDEIVSEYRVLMPKLKAQNPNLKIIFTVSPVRHWKDGAHENQISKSVLHLAINELQNEFDFAHYFPSYELVMDDLRDYRFYASDMIHINSQAVDYIYQYFQESFYSEDTFKTEKQVLKLKQALNHRPFNPETKEHKEFVRKTNEKIEKLKQDYPEINI